MKRAQAGQDLSDFAGRLTAVFKEHHNNTQLAKAIHRSEGALRNWANKRTQPVVDDVLNICRITGTRVEWLMIGAGARYEAELLQIKDEGARYQAPQRLDESLLRAIAEVIERETQGSLKFSAEKKAGLIAHCYRFMGSMAAFDPQAVAQLVKLAGS